MLFVVEKTLLAIILGLFCLSALGVGFFAGQLVHNQHGSHKKHGGDHRHEGSNQPGSDPPVPSEPPSKNAQICLTPTCVRIAAGVLMSMDTSYDPCEDFYHFSNGGECCHIHL